MIQEVKVYINSLCQSSEMSLLEEKCLMYQQLRLCNCDIGVGGAEVLTDVISDQLIKLGFIP